MGDDYKGESRNGICINIRAVGKLLFDERHRIQNSTPVTIFKFRPGSLDALSLIMHFLQTLLAAAGLIAATVSAMPQYEAPSIPGAVARSPGDDSLMKKRYIWQSPAGASKADEIPVEEK